MKTYELRISVSKGYGNEKQIEYESGIAALSGSRSWERI